MEFALFSGCNQEQGQVGVVDMRRVNDQCVKDAQPLPRLHEIMVRQGKSEIFSVLDLRDAYYEIPLADSNRGITGTTTPWGLGGISVESGGHGLEKRSPVLLDEARGCASESGGDCFRVRG